MFMSKFDPLAAIEAKSAIMGGKGKTAEDLEMMPVGKENDESAGKIVETETLKIEEISCCRATSLSPEKDTQEAPTMEWSSQKIYGLVTARPMC